MPWLVPMIGHKRIRIVLTPSPWRYCRNYDRFSALWKHESVGRKTPFFYVLGVSVARTVR